MKGKIITGTIGTIIGGTLAVQAMVDNIGPEKKTGEVELVAKFFLPILLGVGIGHVYDTKNQKN